MNYSQFLYQKTHLTSERGFDPVFMPDFLFPFQKAILDWSIRLGRSAVFADCGLGKTAMQLVWAENVFRKTGKPVLILAPLAVGFQTVSEGAKFGIECVQSRNGNIPGSGPTGYTINYSQQLKLMTLGVSSAILRRIVVLFNLHGNAK